MYIRVGVKIGAYKTLTALETVLATLSGPLADTGGPSAD